ncbi:MAG: type II toxin-antitoxin system VapB family antitoxin [Desulfobacterales bacterium]
MRTNIIIDDKLIKEGMRYTGLKTKTKLVDFALRDLISRRKRKEILKLKGKLKWDGDLEEMRGQRFHDTD